MFAHSFLCHFPPSSSSASSSSSSLVHCELALHLSWFLIHHSLVHPIPHTAANTPPQTQTVPCLKQCVHLYTRIYIYICVCYSKNLTVIGVVFYMSVCLTRCTMHRWWFLSPDWSVNNSLYLYVLFLSLTLSIFLDSRVYWNLRPLW